MRAYYENALVPREQILKNQLNTSTSKQAWSFGKQKRFKQNRSNSNKITYLNMSSTLSNQKIKFPTSNRKVFCTSSDGPCSWIYYPNGNNYVSARSIGSGRQVITANSYINPSLLTNPGPGQYQNKQTHKRWQSMRINTAAPKARKRICLINSDEISKNVPGPGSYHDDTSKLLGRLMLSKYKSVLFPGPIFNKERRFFKHVSKYYGDVDKNPGAPDYQLEQMKRRYCMKIGKQSRKCFVQDAIRLSNGPGPGDYDAPTEFSKFQLRNSSPGV